MQALSFRPVEIFEGLLVGTVLVLVLLFEAFVYRRQTGRGVLDDLTQHLPQVWGVLHYSSPIIFAALSAFGFLRGDNLVAWADCALALLSGITLAWWSIGRARPPGENR